MSENTEKESEYTEEEKREIEAQIRENHPDYIGVLDQMDETREKLQVVDKRRFTTLDLEDVTPQSAGPFGRKLNTEFSPSSTPSPTPGMDFPTALKQVIKGHRVTRLEWENPEIWLIVQTLTDALKFDPGMKGRDFEIIETRNGPKETSLSVAERTGT